MPLYPTSFFIPPAGVPFIVEDKYVRGGYRAAANVAERDAIAVAGRKQGMLVRTQDDNVIWELVGGTSNTFWRVFDATKYIKLGAPLILDSESGSITLDLGDMFNVDGEGRLVIDVTEFLKGSFKDFFGADESKDQQVVTYNHATGTFILKAVATGGGTTYSGQTPIKVEGSNISLEVDKLMSTALVGHFSAVESDNGKALIYDHESKSFVLRTVASSAARASLQNAGGSLAAGATRDFMFATGKSAMLITLTVNVPDVTVECHSTAQRNDANPYRFRSAVGKLSDDGISVLEDSSLQYNRRYAFVVNLDSTPANNTYWRLVNNSASAQTVTVNITYLKIE